MRRNIRRLFQLNTRCVRLQYSRAGRGHEQAYLPRFFSRPLAQVARQPPTVQVRLRTYQEECIAAILSHIGRGHQRLGVSLATGSGKTVIFTQLIDRVPKKDHGGDQTLILVHRRELVEQASRHCSNAYPHKSIEIEMGNLHASGKSDITIASLQSLCSGDRMAKFDAKDFKLILVDEAHHIVAPGYMRVLDHFGLLNPSPACPALVGVSATFSRFDGMRLGAAIDHIVYHKDYVDMIDEEWLCAVRFTTIESKVSLSKVRNSNTGDFLPSDLSKAVNTNTTNEITVRSWIEHGRGRESTIVFCVDLAHVFGLTDSFRKYGVDARYVTGDTSKVERSERLDAFKKGDFPVLLNCGVFTEGTDIPNIDCVLLARPTRSRNLLVQMIGRGMRLHTGKADCQVIDMVSALKSGVVTTPTLFGLDPSQLVENMSVDDLKRLKEQEHASKERENSDGPVISSSPGTQDLPARAHSLKVTEYDSVFDLIEDSSGERHIRAISSLAWTEVAQQKYILTADRGTFLTIEKTDNGIYQIRETRRLPPGAGDSSRFARPREIATAESFADAVHAADTFARETYTWTIVAASQAWRKGPASESQLFILNKFRPTNDQLSPNHITKGKAGDMITKLKHGAQGRFGNYDRARKREEKRAHKEESKKYRESVTVGPLES